MQLRSKPLKGQPPTSLDQCDLDGLLTGSRHVEVFGHFYAVGEPVAPTPGEYVLSAVFVALKNGSVDRKRGAIFSQKEYASADYQAAFDSKGDMLESCVVEAFWFVAPDNLTLPEMLEMALDPANEVSQPNANWGCCVTTCRNLMRVVQ